MVNLETVQYVAVAILDLVVLLVKVLVALIESTIRLFVPLEEVSVANDVVLVTGSAQGIGKELCTQYGELGAKVVCVDVNQTLNEQTVAELKKKGIKATAYKCDVTNRTEVLNLADKIRAEVGDVSILVNNAGIMPCKRLLDHKDTEIRRLFDINIISHFWTLEAFLPRMMDKNRGHIVALSSIAGLEGYPNVVPYNATKFAVRGLMEGMGEEFREDGRDIKVTTICPFAVDTGLCQKLITRFDYLLGMLNPKDVAAAIIKAQRQGRKEISIPGYVRSTTFLLNLLPVKAKESIHDFMGTGLGAHDE